MLLMVPDGIFQNIQVIVGHWRHPTRHLLCSSEILQVRAKPGRARAFLERHQTPFTSSHVASDRKKCRALWLFSVFLHGLRKFLHGKTSWKPVLMVASRMISRWFLVEIPINPTNPHGIRWVSPLFHQQLGQLFINDFTKARNGLISGLGETGLVGYSCLFNMNIHVQLSTYLNIINIYIYVYMI